MENFERKNILVYEYENEIGVFTCFIDEETLISELYYRSSLDSGCSYFLVGEEKNNRSIEEITNHYYELINETDYFSNNIIDILKKEVNQEKEFLENLRNNLTNHL